MSNPKLHRMLHLLCAIHTQPRSAEALGLALGISVPTVKLLIRNLRELGCEIRHTRTGNAARYVLEHWGVFRHDAVLDFLARHAK